MTNGKTKGMRLQIELYRWYLDIAGNISKASANRGVSENLARLLNHLRVLIADGWQLQMSNEWSCADQAGADFIWSHPTYGWYALDAKAVGLPRCPIIRHVTVGSSNEKGEFNQLRFEDKIGLVRILVQLARYETPIDPVVCPAPSCAKARTLVELTNDLAAFQRVLVAASHRLADPRLECWSISLGKSLCYLRNHQAAAGDKSKVVEMQQVLVGHIAAFLDRFIEKSKSSTVVGGSAVRQANFKRSTKLSYVAGEDIVKVLSQGRMLSISGIAAGIRKMFEQRYSALIGKHGAAQWLITMKRIFDQRGIESVIDYVLDRLEARIA